MDEAIRVCRKHFTNSDQMRVLQTGLNKADFSSRANTIGFNGCQYTEFVILQVLNLRVRDVTDTLTLALRANRLPDSFPDISLSPYPLDRPPAPPVPFPDLDAHMHVKTSDLFSKERSGPPPDP